MTEGIRTTIVAEETTMIEDGQADIDKGMVILK